jgi:hypothetical protein
VVRLLVTAHLIGLGLGLGALVCQLVVLGRFKAASSAPARIGSETAAQTIIGRVQEPGIWLAVASGLGLAWVEAWSPLAQGWFHFKMLFVFWLVMATRLMRRNAGNILLLRGQCGGDDSDRLRALKDNHGMIGLVTVLSFLFAIVFSVWKPL